jgi:hypothetical protein
MLRQHAAEMLQKCSWQTMIPLILTDSKISSICFEGTVNSAHLMEHSQGRAFAGLDPMAQ